ncbi:MAG: hypothetical protein WCP25_10355 [Polynucleobacter sp.]
MKHRLLIWILWPSFLIAGLAEGLLFTVVHPQDLLFFGHHPDISDEGIYTIGFLMIWTFCAISSALTAYILPGIEASDSQEIDHGLL